MTLTNSVIAGNHKYRVARGIALLLAGMAFSLSLVTAQTDTAPSKSGYPALGGLWQILNPDQKSIFNRFTIVQTGNSIKMMLILAGKPEVLSYDGTFQTNTLIAGKGLLGNQQWKAMTLTVKDANHIKMEGFPPEFVRATPQEVAIFSQLRKFSFTTIPVKPYDLAGNWKFSRGERPDIVLTQKDGAVVMAFTANPNKPFFKGKYVNNPAIDGEGYITRPGGQMDWTQRRLVVQNPDHIALEGDALYRNSKPTPGDVPCDAQNTNHVSDYYAWMRGLQAQTRKDIVAARCWATISAEWAFPAGQSMLAAMLIADASPDYPRAFDLATKSALSGDIAGEYLLASLYREGKGTARNQATAQAWTIRAMNSQAAEAWPGLNQKTMWGVTPLEVAGFALKATLSAFESSDEDARRFACADAPAYISACR